MGGISAGDVRDLMVATVEHRLGPINTLPHAEGPSSPVTLYDADAVSSDTPSRSLILS